MATQQDLTAWPLQPESGLLRGPGLPASLDGVRLTSVGDRSPLNRPLLGLLCSANCPGDLIVRTYDLARALRDAGVPLIGGFHSPMEKECLDFLLRGTQPVVVCPARGITGMRFPAPWRTALTQGRLLILSPFPASQKRPTTALAETRNRLVAALATTVLVIHATPGGKTESLCRDLQAEGKTLWTMQSPANAALAALDARAFPDAAAVADAWARDQASQPQSGPTVNSAPDSVSGPGVVFRPLPRQPRPRKEGQHDHA